MKVDICIIDTYSGGDHSVKYHSCFLTGNYTVMSTIIYFCSNNQRSFVSRTSKFVCVAK